MIKTQTIKFTNDKSFFPGDRCELHGLSDEISLASGEGIQKYLVRVRSGKIELLGITIFTFEMSQSGDNMVSTKYLR